MVIPRGYIPGSMPATSAPDLSNVDINSGTIDGAIIGSNTAAEATFSKMNTPEIAALLTSHDYQYVYDWSALPAASNFRWIKNGTGSTSIVSNNLVLSMSSQILYYNREFSSISTADTVILEVVVSSITNGNCMYAICDGVKALFVTMNPSGLITYRNVSGVEVTVDTVDPLSINTINIIRSPEAVYIFINSELKVSTTYSSLFPTALNQIFFGKAISSTVATTINSLSYSVLREGSKDLNGTSGKIVGGNQDVCNQAETEGIRIGSNSINSLGTNQDLNLNPNGTGDVVLVDSGLVVDGRVVLVSDGRVKGGLQHRYKGTPYTTDDTVENYEGYIICKPDSNDVEITLPDTTTENIGKELFITNWSMNNTGTVVVYNSAFGRIESEDGIDTGNTTITFTAVNGWVKLIQKSSTNWKVIGGNGFTLS